MSQLELSKAPLKGKKVTKDKTARDKPTKDKKKAKRAARASSDEGSDSDSIVGLRAASSPALSPSTGLITS